MGGGDLHSVVDVAGPGIEGAPEDAGEGQHVVDLVGIVAAAGGVDGILPEGYNKFNALMKRRRIDYADQSTE